MKILVINAGSSSIKYQLIEMDDESIIAKGICERVGQDTSTLVHKGKKDVRFDDCKMPTHNEALKYILDALVNKEYGVLKSMDEIAAVGHRVLISGEKYSDSVLIDDEALKTFESLVDLGPLHMPPNLMGIRACRSIMPKVPMVAVFDNTFHSTMPAHAYMYAINYDDYKKYGIRKYGFHGTSHKFVTGEAEELLGKKDYKLIICHLGNGASISAVKNGKCIDTSMGLTPLEGLVMGTRSGDIDPAVIEFLVNKKGYTVSQATNYLNKECGVQGVSGVGSDFRDLNTASDNGNERATLAMDMFSYRVKKYIGSYAAALGGVDCIAFTGGIGENDFVIRGKILEGLEFLGVTFDKEVNNKAPRGKKGLISNGKTKVYIIPTNEELVIARDTLRLKG